MLTLMANRCCVELDGVDIKLYERFLVAKYGYERVTEALEEIYVNLKKNSHFPTVKEIESVIKPELSAKGKANLIADKIIGYTAKMGYTWGWRYKDPNDWRDALIKEFGREGYFVITNMGGWESLCKNLTVDKIGTIKAQIRDSVNGVIEGLKAGNLPAIEVNSDSSAGYLENKADAN